jgi:hypothetical protein
MNKTRPLPSLLVCVVMDMLGYASYTIPVIGELADIIWAPISSLVFFMMFRGWKGAFGGLFNFVEELLPGLDFIPTFTLTWLWHYFSRPRNVDKQNTAIYVSGRAQPVTNR